EVTERRAQRGIPAFGGEKIWWTGGELNSRHRDFQSGAVWRGVEPAHWDWYRFRPRGSVRPVERSRTTPLPGMPFARLRFAFTLCQHWERGYFTPLQATPGRW